MRISSGGDKYGANAAASGPSARNSIQPDESTTLSTALEAIGLVAVPVVSAPFNDSAELPDRTLRHEVDEAVTVDQVTTC